MGSQEAHHPSEICCPQLAAARVLHKQIAHLPPSLAELVDQARFPRVCAALLQHQAARAAEKQ
jgi:hypothetical protein